MLPVDRTTAQKVLAAQPFSTLVAAELVDFGNGQATLRVPLTTAVQQQNGYAHGGVVAYCVDNSVTFAAGSVLGASVVTRSVNVDYLRPATGDSLIARATVVHHTSRSATCRADIFVIDTLGAEELCAIGHGTVQAVGQRTPK